MYVLANTYWKKSLLGFGSSWDPTQDNEYCMWTIGWFGIL